MKNQFTIFCFIVSIITMNGYSQAVEMWLDFEDIVVQSGSQFTVPVSKDRLDCPKYDCFYTYGGPQAIQIHLVYDSSVIEFVNLNSSHITLTNGNVIQHKPGLISIVWIQQDFGDILDVESVLFNLIFNAIGADGTSTAIEEYRNMRSTWSKSANDGNGGNRILLRGGSDFNRPVINIVGTLGGKDVNVKSKKIFPNPTSEFIDISNYQVTEDYEIYNATGQKILNGSLEASGRVNVQNLQSGTYFLKLESGSTFKFIKE